MCGRKLKNFDVYLQKLEIYIKASKLKLEYSDKITCGGEFVPNRRKIVIEENLTDSETIATILHELGHSEDDSLLPQTIEHKLGTAIEAFHGDKFTPGQRELVLACEARAWKFGKAIAKRLQIPLGKWYAESKNFALKGYRSAK